MNKISFGQLTLSAPIAKAVKEMGFEEATPIQSQAIPLLLEGNDVIGQAQTGTGKTAAFVLPILHRLLTQPQKNGQTRALLVTPTRELAEQIHGVVQTLGKYTPVRSAISRILSQTISTLLKSVPVRRILAFCMILHHKKIRASASAEWRCTCRQQSLIPYHGLRTCPAGGVP